MPYYLIRYSQGQDNTYVYPESLAGVVWKSTMHHHTEKTMVGETDATLKTDGQNVILLTAVDAKKKMEEHRASHPKPDNISDHLHVPPK